MRYRSIAVTVLALLTFIGFAAESRAQPCGPGPHWIDGCGPGTDIFGSGAIVDIDITLDCVADLQLILNGPVTVERQGGTDDSSNFPGALGASVDGHRDVIDTEIVSMSLTGGGPSLFAGQGLSPGGQILTPTLGTVVEQGGNAAVADGFFEVFFEVDLGGANFLYNQAPLQVQSPLDRVPPLGQAFIAGPTCLPLFNAPVAGVLIANIVFIEHTLIPQAPVPALPNLGLVALALLLTASGAFALRFSRSAVR